jgi:hypothetical protein
MTTRPILGALILALGLFAVTAAKASDAYIFEMVVFERPGTGNEFWPADPGNPDPGLARDSLGAGGTLPAASRTLGPIAYTLRQRGMSVLWHGAWRETPGPRNSPSWHWIDAGRISGLVRLTRGRFLHLETDLLLRDAASAQTYRARHYRRMRSDELHYVDHPKVGIVIQARRVPSSATPAPADGGGTDGEPRPAEPASNEPPAPS